MNDIDEIREELRQIHQDNKRIAGKQRSLQSQFESLSIRINGVDQAHDAATAACAKANSAAASLELRLLSTPSVALKVAELEKTVGALHRRLNESLIPWYRRLFK